MQSSDWSGQEELLAAAEDSMEKGWTQPLRMDVGMRP